MRFEFRCIMRNSPLAFIFLLLFSVGCAVNPVTGKKEIRLLSTEQEVALGKATAEQVKKEFGVYRDPNLQQYVEDVGQKLVGVCERKEITYSFEILDTPMVNAFAAPGGFIFVTRGILRELEDEAQLAGVIGHEIGHVVWRHGAKQFEKAFGYQAIILLGEVLTGRDLSQMKQYTDFFVSLMFLGYSRKNEFEADNSGVRYALSAGYDPKGMIEFFAKLKTMEGKPPSAFETLFRSHPPTQERIEKIESYLGEVKPDERKLVRNRERFKELTRNLPADKSPK